eukprot:gene402-475_t
MSSHFKCLSPDQLVVKQNAEVTDVAELLSISTSAAMALLKHFNWRREKLLTKYFESPTDTFAEAGIALDTVTTNNTGAVGTTTTTTTTAQSTTMMCSICGDETDDVTAAACRHFFCNECWGAYLAGKIGEGEASIRCPDFTCTRIVDDATVQRLVAPVVYDKYQAFATKTFLQQSTALRWCPTPGCDNAITMMSDADEAVQCACGRRFCFRCHRESHAPATCEHMAAWEAKCADESETSHWKVANCKQCPKCSVSVEKNGGCNHMNCRALGCNHEWCWICMRPWKGHNDFYVCNRFQKVRDSGSSGTLRGSGRFLQLFGGKKASKKKDNTEDEKEKNKLELQRYLHYYERYLNHDSSNKLEQVIRDEARIKMEELERLNSTWAEVRFIEQGIDQLLECRKVLKFTYIYAFFSFPGNTIGNYNRFININTTK